MRAAGRDEYASAARYLQLIPASAATLKRWRAA
jgi:hypothetical protein